MDSNQCCCITPRYVRCQGEMWRIFFWSKIWSEDFSWTPSQVWTFGHDAFSRKVQHWDSTFSRTIRNETLQLLMSRKEILTWCVTLTTQLNIPDQFQDELIEPQNDSKTNLFEEKFQREFWVLINDIHLNIWKMVDHASLRIIFF